MEVKLSNIKKPIGGNTLCSETTLGNWKADNSLLVNKIRTAQELSDSDPQGYPFIISTHKIIYNNSISEAELFSSQPDLTYYGIFVRTRDTWTNITPLVQAL